VGGHIYDCGYTSETFQCYIIKQRGVWYPGYVGLEYDEDVGDFNAVSLLHGELNVVASKIFKDKVENFVDRDGSNWNFGKDVLGQKVVFFDSTKQFSNAGKSFYIWCVEIFASGDLGTVWNCEAYLNVGDDDYLSLGRYVTGVRSFDDLKLENMVISLVRFGKEYRSPYVYRFPEY
jgi:hypothetical protein